MGWSELHARVHQHLKQSSLLPSGANLLVAVSGGQDSLCLGRLLLDLQSKWHWRLAIAHCDHGWVMDDQIAAHVQNIAAEWQLPFYLCKAEQAIPETEAAARQWRYRQLQTLACQENFAYIVTGHTQTDRAETLLYNLARGSGTTGLGALTWRRSLTAELMLVRPLLATTREETATFCEQFSLPVYLDSYNENLEFARNRLRKKVFPQLKKINAQAEQHFAQTAEILYGENDYLEAIAAEYLQALSNKDQALSQPKLRLLHPALQRRVVRQFLQKNLLKMPTFQQIEAVIALIIAPNKSRTSSFFGNVSFVVKDNWIMLYQASIQ
ncbi:MAG: tRNA lysidine(34) synthetase TilS [Limnothrix sp.]